MKILVTGGLGYVGSHTVVGLAQAGHEIVIVDNLANSELSVLRRLDALCGTEPMFHLGDVRDAAFLRRVLARYRFDGVIHFAGLKSVADSTRTPLDYYDVNVGGSLTLLAALRDAHVPRFVFSSSATVYGDPQTVPIPESHAMAPVNPYGRSKAAVERILEDLCCSEASWSAVSLRYFNPAGAHPSGLIGERPSGVPNNLMPYISQVGAGQRDRLCIFGDDYPTRDGTGERDYVHVMDLAEAHVLAIGYAAANHGYECINLGTGQGYTVLEVVRAYERVNKLRIPCELAARRPGDVASCFADVEHARRRLRWKARRTQDDMCQDAARFESQQSGPAVTEQAVPPSANALRSDSV
jgi:UDP-glucose 4-epimerase